MRLNKVGILTSLGFISATVWILWTQWTAVWPNVEASFVWAVPTFVASHVVLHKKINHVHESVKEQYKNDN